MKAALIVGNDPSCGSLASHLKALGFVTFATEEFSFAVNVLNMTRFDIVVICNPTRPLERRSFASELKCLCRTAKVILVTMSDTTYALAAACKYAGINAVMKGPVTLPGLWRVIEYGLNGLGCHPGWVPAETDRRESETSNASDR